ncbi:MAG: GerMN domain-containing protein [Deltaproteobacteria bacterium]|nr:GerMN domain-containing protein [Deltaproteobacteria bacterium]
MQRKKSGKKSGLLTVLLVAVLTLIAGIVIISVYGDRLFKPARVKPSTAPVHSRTVNLYFSDDEGLHLKAEKRGIKKGPLETEAAEAAEALLEGPKNGGLARAIPEGTRLLGVRVKDSTAILNFSSEIVKNHPGGTSGEMQTIYSIIDTLTLNFPEIKAVQILVEGKKVETLAGHIDTSLPLGPDRLIIKD